MSNNLKKQKKVTKAIPKHFLYLLNIQYNIKIVFLDSLLLRFVGSYCIFHLNTFLSQATRWNTLGRFYEWIGNSDTLPNPSISVVKLSIAERLNISFRWHCIYQHLSASLLTIDSRRPPAPLTPVAKQLRVQPELSPSARKMSVYCNWDSDFLQLTSCRELQLTLSVGFL